MSPRTSAPGRRHRLAGQVGGEWVYLYLLIEFQSRVDKYMALRMMVYVGLLYQDLIKRGEVLADGRLPPSCPSFSTTAASAGRRSTDVVT
jgi:hypothetical protein